MVPLLLVAGWWTGLSIPDKAAILLQGIHTGQTLERTASGATGRPQRITAADLPAHFSESLQLACGLGVA